MIVLARKNHDKMAKRYTSPTFCSGFDHRNLVISFHGSNIRIDCNILAYTRTFLELVVIGAFCRKTNPSKHFSVSFTLLECKSSYYLKEFVKLTKAQERCDIFQHWNILGDCFTL